jgi:hypothetical protein
MKNVCNCSRLSPGKSRSMRNHGLDEPSPYFTGHVSTKATRLRLCAAVDRMLESSSHAAQLGSASLHRSALKQSVANCAKPTFR